MQIKSDYWLELGPLGEQAIEIDADVEDLAGAHPIFGKGIDISIYKVTLVLNNQTIDITDLVMKSSDAKVIVDRISDTWYEAKQEALAYRARRYRHVDCHA